MRDKEEIVKEMQQVVEQMRLDDIEENPDVEKDFFVCDACGGYKCVAGSILYGEYRLCNDCVLMYELALKLGKIQDIEEFIAKTEDTRLKQMCDFIKQDKLKENN